MLCASLSGHAENTPDGVGRVRDALDELGATIEPEVEVATLDVTAFSNASDDACAILTNVFAGLPSCWITQEWNQQHGGERWDLPVSERMAETLELAIARVVGWRRAGTYEIAFTGGASEESRWIERGLLVRELRDGSPTMEDLYYRNRLVERTIFGTDPVFVRYPETDRTGEQHEAMRRKARLVSSRGLVIEADFSPYSTRRPLPDNWVELIDDLVAMKTLGLRGCTPREADVLRALTMLPSLEVLEIDRGASNEHTITELRRERPTLTIR